MEPPMSYVLVLVTSPTFWAFSILMVLGAAIAGMLFKKINGSPAKVAAYRSTGIDFACVFIPFAVLGVAHWINGTFPSYLQTPELPMAAVVAAVLCLVHLYRAQLASKRIASHKIVILACAISVLLVPSGVLIFHIVLSDGVTPWIAVLNALWALLVLWLSYGFAAAVNAVWASG